MIVLYYYSYYQYTGILSNIQITKNAIRRAGMHDDGVFNDCQLSDQEFDDEIASIDSQTNVMD